MLAQRRFGRAAEAKPNGSIAPHDCPESARLRPCGWHAETAGTGSGTAVLCANWDRSRLRCTFVHQSRTGAGSGRHSRHQSCPGAGSGRTEELGARSSSTSVASLTSRSCSMVARYSANLRLTRSANSRASRPHSSGVIRGILCSSEPDRSGSFGRPQARSRTLSAAISATLSFSEFISAISRRAASGDASRQSRWQSANSKVRPPGFPD